MIGTKFDKAIRPLVLIMHEMNGYVKTFKVEYKNNNVFSYRSGIDDETLLEKYRPIWTRTEDLKK